MPKRALPSPELIRKAQSGDKRSIAELIQASMWIVHACVRAWAKHDEADDLMQVALAGASVKGCQFGGVMRAVETYDEARGANFWSHVTGCVNSALRRHFERQQHPMLKNQVSLGLTEYFFPVHQNPEQVVAAREELYLIARLARAEAVALLGWGEGRTFTEIGAELGVSRETARKIALMGRERMGIPQLAGSCRNR